MNLAFEIGILNPVPPRIDSPPFSEIAITPGITAVALAVWFRTPHPTMPNFVLSADETSDLIAYILSLQSD